LRETFGVSFSLKRSLKSSQFVCLLLSMVVSLSASHVLLV
jgi:hypothetical protein